MVADERLRSDRFPRASAYHPEWVLAGVSGGANPLRLTEWLTESLDLNPGMRVLDLGCGRALSSVFLRREFDVQVWAVDLWFSASENGSHRASARIGKTPSSTPASRTRWIFSVALNHRSVAQTCTPNSRRRKTDDIARPQPRSRTRMPGRRASASASHSVSHKGLAPPLTPASTHSG